LGGWTDAVIADYVCGTTDKTYERRLIQIVVRQLANTVIEDMGTFVGDIGKFEVGVPIKLFLNGQVPGVYSRQTQTAGECIEVCLLLHGGERALRAVDHVRCRLNGVGAIKVIDSERRGSREHEGRHRAARAGTNIDGRCARDARIGVDRKSVPDRREKANWRRLRGGDTKNRAGIPRVEHPPVAGANDSLWIDQIRQADSRPEVLQCCLHATLQVAGLPGDEKLVVERHGPTASQLQPATGIGSGYRLREIDLPAQPVIDGQPGVNPPRVLAIEKHAVLALARV